MGRFGAGEVDNYGGHGGAGYFSLKNDKDVARVRFLYNGIEDVEGYAVHEVYINDKKRYVNCLRAYNEPMEKCPFCRDRKFQTVKVFIALYNIDEDRIQIWERGKQFFSRLSSLCARYSNLVSHTFEIERNGKAGSTSTTYEIYETGEDGTKLSDLPEVQPILGTLVLDKTEEELEYYLKNGEFPSSEGGDEEDVPFRRREDRRAVESQAPQRRTPLNRRDRF